MEDKTSGLFGFLVSVGGIIPYSEETKRFVATGYKCPNCGHRMFGSGVKSYSADGKELGYWRLSHLLPDSIGCAKCNYRWKCFRDSQCASIETHKPQPLDSIGIDQPNMNIHLEKESERIRTSSETVLVPAGVKITVKRSRTIEHTVDVSWSDLKGGSLNLGLMDAFGISIKNEIERKRGRSYKESETIEYEVELNGDKVSQYNLVWADIWCKGFIELAINNTTQMLPFRFRDSSELEVMPAENK